MEEQTYDRLEDFRSGITPGGKLVRKAWDKYDPNKLGRVRLSDCLSRVPHADLV